jgi:deoxyribodipyrimidine photo-lyase
MHLSAGPRIRIANSQPVRPEGQFVLYWMIAARRPASNFALDRAIAWARHLGQPLVVLEALRVDYPWASDRLHRFVLDGMRDNALAFGRTPALYYPYVEPRRGAGKGLLSALAGTASLVVTDDFPCFFLPRMVEAAAARLDVRLEVVDSNGLVPLVRERAFSAAAHYRRFMQKRLAEALADVPAERPFGGATLPRLRALPTAVTRRWPAASPAILSSKARALRALPIDHAVPPVAMRGGPVAAKRALQSFVAKRLATYHEGHNHPDRRGTSRLSPYLHFGHLSAHDVFNAVMRKERWTLGRLPAKATGSREGWWHVGPGAEAFLDQLVVWRELAYHTCAARPNDYDAYASLPAWARQTLEAHVSDPRPHVYTLKQFERASTHDPLWNAAEREMLRDGWFHNYLRMLWGKKILEWSPTPEAALEVMMAIMNRWSLDGRNPNSYAGYFWTLGRYDRPWPERAIYGKVRSMSSESTARKVEVTDYLRRYAAKPEA